MEAGLVAFGFLALPKISQLVAENKIDFIRLKVEDILIMTFQLGLIITIHTFIWSKEIILLWLGNEYLEVVPIMKIIIVSLSPYLAYVLLRSIVDAVEIRAINTFNLFISLMTAIFVSLILYSRYGIIGLAWGTTVGFITLGALTYRYLLRRYHISFKNFMCREVLILNIFIGAIIILAKKFLASYLSLHILLFIGFLIECILFVLYLCFFYKRNTRWLFELKKRIIIQS